MSETQAKGKKIDMKISRKTINAIHQRKSSSGNFNTFQDNQVIEAPNPPKKSLSLKISRKKDAPVKRTIGLATDTNSQNSESSLVDELLADLAINTEATDGIVSEPSNNTSDIFTKIDAIDSDDFSISNNDIPVDFDAIDKVYSTNNISEIQTIKRDNSPKRTVKRARRGIVKEQKNVEKPEEEKPYYMVIDTDINYDEILSRPNKKAAEMIDQNSPFFYTPNVFNNEDIKYSDVDLTENYGGDFLLEDYITPDNGIKHNFIGGSDDEDYFKRPKPKDYYSRRNTYIIESHEADDSAFDIIERIGKYDLDIVDRINDLEADDTISSTTPDDNSIENAKVEDDSTKDEISKNDETTKNSDDDSSTEVSANTESIATSEDKSESSEDASSQDDTDTKELAKEVSAIPESTDNVDNNSAETPSSEESLDQSIDNVDELMSDELLAEILASDNNDDLSEITKMIDDSSKGGFESKIFGTNANDEDDSDLINALDNLEDLEDLENLNKIENINDLDTLDHLDDVDTTSELVESAEDTIANEDVPISTEASNDLTSATDTEADISSNDFVLEKNDYNLSAQDADSPISVAAENIFNFGPVNNPVQESKPRKSKFSNSIFKTFTFDDSADILGREEVESVRPAIDESIHESYLDKANETIIKPDHVDASTPASIQKPVIDASASIIEKPTINNPVEVAKSVPVIPDLDIVADAKPTKSVTSKQDKNVELDEEPLYDLDSNNNEDEITHDEDELEMVLHTSTTFMENDYDNYNINDTDDEALDDDYTMDDDSGIEFDDTDSYGYTEDGFKRLIPPDDSEIKKEAKEPDNDITDASTDTSEDITDTSEDITDTSTDTSEDIADLNIDDINLDDINIDDIDLNEIDLTNDDFLKDLTTPSSEEISQKLSDEFSSLDKELRDVLFSEVMQEEDTDSDKENSTKNNPEGDDSDEKLEDNEFYKLINSLSNTISNLENSISMPDPVQEPVKEKEEQKKSGKAINILINKDDIFSISIENETYDIVADFKDISVVSQNINISTPKNNFFTKIGNKYIEIHRKEDTSFVVYTNFEDIEFENAINNINFAKKKDKIELNIKESFKLASIDNKVSLSILNSNIAKIKRPGSTTDDESEEDKSNSVCDNDVLTINEETQKVYLPYKIEDVMNMIKNPANGYHTIKEVVEGEYTIPMSTFKPPIVSRFKEAYNFMRTKENSSVYAALDLALELMFNANLNPAIIRACNNLRELNVYLDCLYENELEKFDCFKIVYKVLPRIQ